jgi:chemotaxis protein CheZ
MPPCDAAPPPQTDTALRDALRSVLQPMMSDLHRFVDRRIAELSAEVNASVQLADMTEARLSRELGQVYDRIAALVAVPGAGARSSGLELEAVVSATEAAANTIMQAGEAILDWIQNGARDAATIESLAEQVNSIFEACSFQDVTGQRIRRAIQHLQQVETMLDTIAPRPPVATTPVLVRTALHTVSEDAQTQQDLAQAEIDALMRA